MNAVRRTADLVLLLGAGVAIVIALYHYPWDSLAAGALVGTMTRAARSLL